MFGPGADPLRFERGMVVLTDEAMFMSAPKITEVAMTLQPVIRQGEMPCPWEKVCGLPGVEEVTGWRLALSGLIEPGTGCTFARMGTPDSPLRVYRT